MAHGTIGEGTRISLKLAIGAIVIALAIAGAWFDISHGLKDVRRDVGEVRLDVAGLRLEVSEASGDRWKKLDDKRYMKELGAMNDLKMPEHQTVEEARILGDLGP